MERLITAIRQTKSNRHSAIAERNLPVGLARRVSVTFLRGIAGEGFSCLAFFCLTLGQQKNAGQENVFQSSRAKF
jgi:hypothetical protein